MLEWRSGGWVLALALVLVVGAAAWRLAAILPTLDQRAVGDGVNPETYGFDLSTSLVPRELIVAAGPDLRKDGLPSLDAPRTISAQELAAIENAEGGPPRLAGVQRLLDEDRVLGVAVDGDARAYPLWMLAWHEVCNDTLGQTPVLVTYHPLCDSTAVFERRVDGAAVSFGVSGLLFNSNLLMFDRRPDPAAESLWSQLQFRAVAGPAATSAERLRVLPSAVTTWGAWRAAYPQTTVALPDPARKRLYRRDAYGRYFQRDNLLYPVEPLPPEGPRAFKQRIVAVADDDGNWTVTDATLGAPEERWSDQPRVHAFRFAWHAVRAHLPQP